MSLVKPMLCFVKLSHTCVYTFQGSYKSYQSSYKWLTDSKYQLGTGELTTKKLRQFRTDLKCKRKLYFKGCMIMIQSVQLFHFILFLKMKRAINISIAILPMQPYLYYDTFQNNSLRFHMFF